MRIHSNISSQGWEERCRDIAEFYDIDWYAGEFRDVFAANVDPRWLYKELQNTHTDICLRRLTATVAQANMQQRLKELRANLADSTPDPHEKSWVTCGKQGIEPSRAWRHVQANGSRSRGQPSALSELS